MRATVVLMVKSPVLGEVKTRMAAVIGKQAALEIYRLCVIDMVDILEASQLPYIVAYTPGADLSGLDKWLKIPKSYMAQAGRGLGERLGNVFTARFSTGDPRVIALNSDTPDLSPSILVEGAMSLENHEAVIGPCTDGGYYVIGFQRDSYVPEIFEGIPWSTDAVFEETLEILFRHELDTRVLPPWRDLDKYEDLKDYPMKKIERWGRRTRERAAEIIEVQENTDNTR